MPVRKCPNGKYKIGKGKCMYPSKKHAEAAYKGYLGHKYGESMNKSEELLSLIGEYKMFNDLKDYKDMLSKYISNDLINKHDSFIKKSFDMDVSIPELAKQINKLEEK